MRALLPPLHARDDATCTRAHPPLGREGALRMLELEEGRPRARGGVPLEVRHRAEGARRRGGIGGRVRVRDTVRASPRFLR